MADKYSIYEHGNRFDTEQKCHDFLMQIRWENGIPTCPECGNSHMNYYLKTRKLYKCSACKKQFSLIKGTIFEKSKIPLTKWFMAIYMLTTKKRGISSVQLAKWIGVGQPTAWFMLHRLREAMKEENNIVLNGIVEADEVFLFPKVHRDRRLQVARKIHEEEQDRIHGMSEYKRGKLGIKLKNGRKKGSTKEVLKQKSIERGGKPYDSHDSYRVPFEKGVVVLGMLEKGGRIVMKTLGENSRSANRKNIIPLLRKHILSNSDIVTDESILLYRDVDKLFSSHKTVNHKKGFVINGITTNGIENAWKQLEAMIDGTYTHITYRHADRYLNEQTYRWNRQKKSMKTLFDEFMPLVAGKQVSYERLTKKIAA